MLAQSVWLTAIEFQGNLRSWLSKDDFSLLIKTIIALKICYSAREKLSMQWIEILCLNSYH